MPPVDTGPFTTHYDAKARMLRRRERFCHGLAAPSSRPPPRPGCAFLPPVAQHLRTVPVVPPLHGHVEPWDGSEARSEGIQMQKMIQTVILTAAVAGSLGTAQIRAGENYAVLFCGGANRKSNHPRYHENIGHLYWTLTGLCGLSSRNVYVLFADGRSPAVDRSDGQNSDLRWAVNAMPATRRNLRRVLAWLGRKVGRDDHFLFYSCGHGNGDKRPSVKGEEVLWGWHETIKDEELATWLGYVNAGHATYVFAQCFAGGDARQSDSPRAESVRHGGVHSL